MMNRTSHFVDRLYVIGAALSGLSIIIVVCLVLGEIFAREAFGRSILVSVEYTTYLLVAITFFGLAYTQRMGQMIYVGLIYDKVSAQTRVWMDLGRTTIALAYGLIVTWYVFKFTYNSYDLDQRAMTIMNTPLYLPQATMVVGLVLITVEWCRAFFISIRRVIGSRLA